MNYQPGDACTVNGDGDLMMDRDDGRLIGQECVIIKQCKSGLFQVALSGDRKFVRTIPKRNISRMVYND